MKKIVSIALAALLTALMIVSASAANGMFVKSPSTLKTPEIVNFHGADTTFDAKINVAITAYANRANLRSEYKTSIENAYNSIKAPATADQLKSAITSIANAKNVDADKLYVADLFDMEVMPKNVPTAASSKPVMVLLSAPKAELLGSTPETYEVEVEVKAETLNGFEGLLSWDGSKWTVVDGAAVNTAGNLVFKVTGHGQYAIVVDGGKISDPTGDFTWVWAVVLAGAASALTVVVIKRRKASEAV